MRGIDIFREYFKNEAGQYVLIGGAACDLLFQDADQAFRATKDLDLVLMVEALTPEFGRKFWGFINAGGYENRAKSTGEPQLYRFDKPKDPAFPYMIELFGRTGFELGDQEAHLTPIHIDDEVSSLSAILLDEEYYLLLKDGQSKVDEISVLSVEGLIAFKAKAWLDMTKRKHENASADDQNLKKNIKKHLNDVCRLATLLTGAERPNLSPAIRNDMQRFLEAYRDNPVDPKALGIKGVNAQDIIEVLQGVFEK